MPRARPYTTQLYRHLHYTARRHRPPGAIVDNDWPTFEPPHTHTWSGPGGLLARARTTPRSCVHTIDMYSWHTQLTEQLIARVVHGTIRLVLECIHIHTSYVYLYLTYTRFTHIYSYRCMMRHLHIYSIVAWVDICAWFYFMSILFYFSSVPLLH